MRTSIKAVTISFLLSLAVTSFLIIAPVANANYESPHDYYKPAPDDLLENVEKFHLQEGIEFLQQGKFDLSLKEFSFILHYFPNHPAALQYIVLIDQRTNNHTNVEKFFKKAFELYPNTFSTHLIYGNYLYKNNKVEQAIYHYKKAAELNPDDAESFYSLGLAYIKENDYQNAETAARKAYSLGYPLPGLKEKLHELGISNKK